MLNKKILKFFSATLITSSILATDLTVISCSKKDKSVATSWDDFKEEAQKETAFNIVQVSQPQGWENANTNELSRGVFSFDNDAHKVKVNITRTKQLNSWVASFEIHYMIDNKYDVNNWICSKEPSENASSWDFFKKDALAVTAADLIAQARNSKVIKNLKWSVGDASQTIWITTDEAEFDTFGAVDKTNSYPGMKGKPIAHEYNDNKTKNTVTAIISKKGKNGAYDSDPITVKATYTLGQTYKISDWIFTKTEQWNSIEKEKILFDSEVALSKNNFGKFENSNWLYFPGGNTEYNNIGKKHGGPNQFLNSIFKNQYPGAGNFRFKSSDFASLDSPKGSQSAYICFFFNIPRNDDYRLLMNFYFNYKNGINNKGGVSTFNYVWSTQVLQPETIK